MCVCTPEIKSPYCARCQPSLQEVAEQRKQSALKLLGPIGFVDADDTEAPGAIWHRQADITINVMMVKEGDLVGIILEVGREQGRSEAQKAMRKACGLG